MAFPNWYPGDLVTAPGLNGRNWRMVAQDNDLTLTGGSTLYQDTDIVVPVESGAIYYYHLFLSYSARADTGFRWRWQAPDDCLLASFTMALALSPSTGADSGGNLILRRPGNLTDRVAGGNSANANPPAVFNSAYDAGSITVGGSAGNVILQVDRPDVTGDAILRGGNQTRMIFQRIA